MSPAAGPALADALLAVRLCVADPRLGGMILRGNDVLREMIIAQLPDLLPAGAPIRRLPVGAEPDVLDGGIDVAALSGSGLRAAPGLIDRVADGLLLVPMPDRLPIATTAGIAAALDRSSGFLIAALDEAAEEAPQALADRLAFWIDLDRTSIPDPERAFGPALDPGETLEVVVTVAAALGVVSMRAALLALRAARAIAAAAGRAEPSEPDLIRAIRLVLAPRATVAPSIAESPSAPPPSHHGEQATEPLVSGNGLTDHVLASARAAIDPDLLAALELGKSGRREGAHARGPGERRRSPLRGRRAGTRTGPPTSGARLALPQTLLAAAPWQSLRGRVGRVLLHRSDLRIHRFEARAEPLTIFAVDASGSTAIGRLAEAKGAVELLLSQAYVQRAEVALIAFRGAAAEVVLPPTRSLTRARRLLAELPGGGGTPLAGGIAAAHTLALTARNRGLSAAVVLLSDGRANVDAAGHGGRVDGVRDALAAARALAADRIATLFIDTSVHPRPEAARLAEALRADYVPLPQADAATILTVVATLAPGRT